MSNSPRAREESQPLTKPQTNEETSRAWSDTSLLKYGSLGLVIVQNSSHVLLLRYSRVASGNCEGYVVRHTIPSLLRSSLLYASPLSPQAAHSWWWCLMRQ
eukprot:scaffold217701_cov35-Tisochrysis_lutea.AAC.5